MVSRSAAADQHAARNSWILLLPSAALATPFDSTQPGSYLANSMLVSNIPFKTKSVAEMSTTKVYNNLNWLTAVTNADGSGNPLVLEVHQHQTV